MYPGTYRACGPWGQAALLPRVRTTPDLTYGPRVPAQLHRDLLIAQGASHQPVLAAVEVVLPIDLHPLGIRPDDVRRLGLGLLAAELLSAAVEDAAQVQVVALLCRLEGRPESARRGLVDAGENQKLLALRAQIVHRQGTRWPTADRGRIVEGLDVVGKLLRQDRRGTTRRRGKAGGEGDGVGDCCDGMGVGCRGQGWCDGRGAHIAIPGGWTRTPLFGAAVSQCPSRRRTP